MGDRTHHAECWRQHRHHDCAIAEVERLRAELVEEKTGRGLLATAHDNHMAALTEVARLRATCRCCGRPLRGGRCPSVLSPEADPTEVTE